MTPPPRLAILVCGALAFMALAAPRRARAQTGRELNVFPIVGGDSDVGVGAGGLGDWAALAPGRPAFRWRLEAAAFATLKDRDPDGFIVPYQDAYLDLVIPRWGTEGHLGLDARISYTDEHTMKYTGIGNASPPLPPGAPLAIEEYRRLHPTLSFEVRARVFAHTYLLLGTAYTENRLRVPPDTILAQQQAFGPPDVRALLGSFAPHGVELVTAEAQIDTRDDEIVTHTGQFHTLRFRLSPVLGPHVPYGYERLTLTLRFYRTPIERWLMLAARFVGDTLIGDSPFYEMARFDETPAIGGGKALRGVPAQRFYGKVKVFANLEASSEVLPFTIGGKRYILGVATFVDTGRTWTELFHPHPELDGTGLGLKVGVGGGLRLQEGRTFVVRIDVAWSPDADPVGAYFAAGRIF